MKDLLEAKRITISMPAFAAITCKGAPALIKSLTLYKSWCLNCVAIKEQWGYSDAQMTISAFMAAKRTRRLRNIAFKGQKTRILSMQHQKKKRGNPIELDGRHFIIIVYGSEDENFNFSVALHKILEMISTAHKGHRIRA